MHRQIVHSYDRLATYAVISISVGVVVLLLETLAARSMWYDEAYTYCFVASSWHEFITTISRLDIGIVLYYALLRLWSDVFGQSQYALRLFSVIWAVASLFAIYWLTRELFSHRAGLIAAALLVVNSFWFQQAQTARVYSMATCIALLSSVAFVRAVRKPAGGRWAATYVTLMAILSISQFAIASGVFIGQFLSFFVMRERTIATRVAIASGTAVALILLSTALIISFVGSTLVHTPVSISMTSIWQHISSLLGRKYAPLLLGLLGTIGVIGGINRNRDVIAVLIWSISPIVFILVLALNDSAALGARYMLGALGPFLVLAAYGISLIERRAVLAAALLVAFGSECFGLVNYFNEPWQDFDKKIHAIAKDVRVGDEIVFSPPYLAVRAYVALHYDGLTLAAGSRTIPSPLSDAWRTVDQTESHADFQAIPSVNDRTLWIFRMKEEGDVGDSCSSSVLPLPNFSKNRVSSICVR